jgi:hypothetical protein
VKNKTDKRRFTPRNRQFETKNSIPRNKKQHPFETRNSIHQFLVLKTGRSSFFFPLLGLKICISMCDAH